MVYSNKKSTERRSSGRDRRILDGIMKYCGDFLPIELMDLSENGAYIHSPNITPSLLDSLTVSIDFPQLGCSVTVVGRVRRVGLGSREFDQKSGFGLQFTRYFTPVGQDMVRQHLYN